MTNLKLFIDEQIAYILALEHYAVVLFKLLFINFLLASSKIRVFFFFFILPSHTDMKQRQRREKQSTTNTSSALHQAFHLKKYRLEQLI